MKDEPVQPSQPAKNETTQPREELKNRNYGNITISGGNVLFGDGNTLNQVHIKELVQALAGEIKEKVPEGEEKNRVMKSLKTITENDSFASVAGTVIGEVIKRISL